jgi:ADP-L-glycero-D-manno-heptose 6-epimerase
VRGSPEWNSVSVVVADEGARLAVFEGAKEYICVRDIDPFKYMAKSPDVDGSKEYMVVTGAAGFIGSALAGYLNGKGITDLILVDEFNRADKAPNLEGKKFAFCVERDSFFDWLAENRPRVGFVFHIGARTDTTEFDYSVHERLNVEYSKKIWAYCTEHQVPLVYASSAATYGAGEQGYEDRHDIIPSLRPLNAYGVSKNEFDKWALEQAGAKGTERSEGSERILAEGEGYDRAGARDDAPPKVWARNDARPKFGQPPFWAGLKFFNVYGPNEYHKGRMASVIFHSFHQVRRDGVVKLFRSHRPDYKDGQQLRDFVYVKDVIRICYWLMEHRPASGIYNLGTGIARSFEDLVKATYGGLDLPANIRYIDMPEDIRDKYQYFTEANMKKLRAAGYKDPFYTLEEGVDDYVRNYLAKAAFL